MNLQIFSLKIGENIEIEHLNEDGITEKITVSRIKKGWIYNRPNKKVRYLPEIFKPTKGKGKYSIS